jgi:hypothetical protein
VRIEGDVQFAAEVNWLVDHVRWDAEEDLSRLIGDAPAHTIAWGIGRGMAQALRTFVGKLPGAGQGAPMTRLLRATYIVWVALRYGLDELVLTSFQHPGCG